MKKFIIFTFLMLLATPSFAATNWSKFENRGNNLHLEGYQSQPGYIAFEDGDGNIMGYLYYNEAAGEPYWVSPDGLALSTGTRIDEGSEVGVPLSEFSGNGNQP